jgi:RNA recognition motif-containing protein
VSSETFVSYFEKYGKIIDSVIMKDRQTHRPRGFGFITYEDPSAVEQVIQETHIINGKQVSLFSLKNFNTTRLLLYTQLYECMCVFVVLLNSWLHCIDKSTTNVARRFFFFWIMS